MELRTSRVMWGLQLAALLAGLASFLSAGCNRAHYRRQADAEGLALIQEKTNSGHWPLDTYSPFVDPRSRMFDPFNPDTPPMPEDDPAAHELMHKVDGKNGYPGWHYSGSTDERENPVWMDYLPLDERGVLVLDAPTALRLARLHSRPYQQEQEELYLSALDVSFERFRFDTQFFAGYQAFYNADGPDRIVNGGDSRSLFDVRTYSKGRQSNAWTMQRAFSSGADLVVGFANSLVWQFSGPDDYVGTTLIDFSLVQPLLRGAGRDRVLERLTVSERSLLANVRLMERYRQAFYVDVIAGRSSQNTGPVRRGGVLGGAGLDGFSGVGNGGFGRLATNVQGANNTGAGAGQVGGFMGLLQTQLQIRNQEINIKLLRDNLEQLREQLAEEKQKPLGANAVSQNTRITRLALQVEQAQQTLVVSEARLMNSMNTFETTLDGYKIALGLPPELCVEITDPMLDGFYLIDDRIETQRQYYQRLRQLVGGHLLDVRNQIRTIMIEQNNQTATIHVLDWYPVVEQSLVDLADTVAQVERVPQELLDVSIEQARGELERFRQVVPKRKEQLRQLEASFLAQRSGADPCVLLPLPKADVDAVAAEADRRQAAERTGNPHGRLTGSEIFSAARLDTVETDLQEQLERIETSIRDTQEKLQAFRGRVMALRDEGPELSPIELGAVAASLVTEMNTELETLNRDILDLELLQARLRSETVMLPSVNLPIESAVDIANRYRLDLMNARASLVDQWRLIEYNADNLESTLDLVFQGDVTNRGDNPFKIAGNTGRLRVGVQFDAPIVRLSERNTYRQTLIEYQQARRNFYAALDSISQSLRAVLRTMETNRITFELQRLAVAVAARQNNYNNELLQLTQSAGDTAARDTVQALTDLLNAQNDFMNIWVNYEALRRTLDLELGTLQLDEEGIWIDPGEIGPDYLQRMEQTINYFPDGGYPSWYRSTPLPRSEDGEMNEAPDGAVDEGAEPIAAPRPLSAAATSAPRPLTEVRIAVPHDDRDAPVMNVSDSRRSLPRTKGSP